MKYIYLGLDILVILVPLLFSFHPRIRFSNHLRAFFVSNLIASSFFVLWDSIFASMGVWHFNPAYISGIYLFNLPLEEVFFFICIPFSCVFTYFCMAKFGYSVSRFTENIFRVVFPALLIIAGIYFRKRIYTVISFEATALFYLYVRYVVKANWTGSFLVAYMVLLLPFLLCNGLLTGSGLREPIVYYNPSQIIGLRIFSIPVEDFVYSFSLQLLNVYLFEYFKGRFQRKTALG
jgi:lycopene cyclase domain-containing protein